MLPTLMEHHARSQALALIQFLSDAAKSFAFRGQHAQRAVPSYYATRNCIGLGIGGATVALKGHYLAWR